jgi:hypothetical protein
LYLLALKNIKTHYRRRIVIGFTIIYDYQTLSSALHHCWLADKAGWKIEVAKKLKPTMLRSVFTLNIITLSMADKLITLNIGLN